MSMDIDVARTLITLASFVVFLGICFWAYSGKRAQQFEEAANLPFDDEETHDRTLKESSTSNSTKKSSQGEHHYG